MGFSIHLVICGPSPERGISINSARSVVDHLDRTGIDVRIHYMSLNRQIYRIPQRLLCQNTPDDFEFRLAGEYAGLRVPDPVKEWRAADLVFPIGHGLVFDDGELARQLESEDIPFVGPTRPSCESDYDKWNFRAVHRDLFGTAPPAFLVDGSKDDTDTGLDEFLAGECQGNAIIKPCQGGSSIGVERVRTRADVRDYLVRRGRQRVLIQPDFKASGHREFSLIILQAESGQPVPLIPTEVACEGIFDYRRKYLPCPEVERLCPPTFLQSVVGRIRDNAAVVFSRTGLRDFVRIDGWVGPSNDFWFSDVNVISGMEQNSFFFLQTAEVGLTHRDALLYLLHSACRRRAIPFDVVPKPRAPGRQRVRVLLGGMTSERQISVQSGTNVWLKLLGSDRFDPAPYLIGTDGSELVVRPIAYTTALHHTVEDMTLAIGRSQKHGSEWTELRTRIRADLGLPPLTVDVVNEVERPWHEFVDDCRVSGDAVFLALHGGAGENGVVQASLTGAGVPFNGSGPAASALCMDKARTKALLDAVRIPGVTTVPGRVIATESLRGRSEEWFRDTWDSCLGELAEPHDRTLLIKPTADGCSTGVVRLSSWQEFLTYCAWVVDGHPTLPPSTFRMHPNDEISLPSSPPQELLVERYFQTGKIAIEHGRLVWPATCPWVEATVTLVECGGRMRAFQPTITLRSGEALSIEEKFQSGTGVNITPPPPEFVAPKVVRRVKRSIETVSRCLDLAGFARVDLFLHCGTGDVVVIEVNTLPGMTPATALFHSALAEPESIRPRDLLEAVMAAGIDRERRWGISTSDAGRRSSGFPVARPG